VSGCRFEPANPSADIVSMAPSSLARRTTLGGGFLPPRRIAHGRIVSGLCSAVLAIFVSGCSGGAASPSSGASHDLTVYHWWTAGGERQAMDKIEADFHAAYPYIVVHDNPTAGGGGITLETVVQGKLAAGVPPDTFQSHAGGELKTYVDGGYLENVDDIWVAQGLDAKYPSVLARMVTFSGHKMAIPVSIHRANWLFYNVPIFTRLGLQPPTNVDEMIADAKILKANGIAPLGLGTRDKWTALDLFDTVLLSVGDPDVYEQFYTGRLDAEHDPRIGAAFTKFKELMPFIYADHGSATWSDMPAQLADGHVGMMVLGDFAAPLLTSLGSVEGRDWEAVGFPRQPSEVFLMVIDTFTRPSGIEHPDATTAWLDNLVSPTTQADFTVLKGSIAPNQDVPVSTYSTSIQRRASEGFQTLSVVPSSVHGALAPLSFLDDWLDVLTVFVYSPDVGRALHQTSVLMKSYDVAGNSVWYWAR
jgi:glucose/mannose transport system substrate-binding protein